MRGILVTEGVRGDGGILKNNKGERFMFNYIPEKFAAGDRRHRRGSRRAGSTATRTRAARPSCSTRDVVARAITAEVKAGRGSPHGGVFLDIASRRPADFIKRKLPSMYHQFKELAEVDITKEPMEVGPTLHYFMGGIRVDADTQMTTVPGLFACGECAAGMHGANRLGGNSLSRPDRVRQARRRRRGRLHRRALRARRKPVDEQITAARSARRPSILNRETRREPVPAPRGAAGHAWSDCVGIVRTKDELEQGDRRARGAQASAQEREGARREPVQPGLARGARRCARC